MLTTTKLFSTGSGEHTCPCCQFRTTPDFVRGLLVARDFALVGALIGLALSWLLAGRLDLGWTHCFVVTVLGAVLLGATGYKLFFALISHTSKTE